MVPGNYVSKLVLLYNDTRPEAVLTMRTSQYFSESPCDRILKKDIGGETLGGTGPERANE